MASIFQRIFGVKRCMILWLTGVSEPITFKHGGYCSLNLSSLIFCLVSWRLQEKNTNQASNPPFIYLQMSCIVLYFVVTLKHRTLGMVVDSVCTYWFDYHEILHFPFSIHICWSKWPKTDIGTDIVGFQTVNHLTSYTVWLWAKAQVDCCEKSIVNCVVVRPLWWSSITLWDTSTIGWFGVSTTKPKCR